MNNYIKITNYLKGKKIYFKELTAEEKKELEQGYLHGDGRLFAKHCPAILLSHQGFSLQELMKIFDSSKNTIDDWFNNWESKGIEGCQLQVGAGEEINVG